MATTEKDILDPDRAAQIRKRLEEARARKAQEPQDRASLVRQRLEATRATVETPQEPAPEGPGAISRFFHQAKGRLGFGQEAARGLARTPGQAVEGAGGVLQAFGAKVEEGGRRERAFDLPADLREKAGIELPDRTKDPIRRAIAGGARKAGEFLEETGRESREFFPASTEVDRGDLTDPNALIAGGAEAIGQLGTQIVLAAGTGGASAVTRFLMFASPTIAMEGGNAFLETRERLTEEGMSIEEAESKAAGVAASTGLGALALERIPAARFVFNKLPGAERLFATRMAAALAGRGGAVGALVGGAAAEGIEEMSQEVWSSVVQDIQADNPEAWEDIGKRLAASGVFGGIGGAFGGVITRTDAGPETAPEGAPVAPPVEEGPPPPDQPEPTLEEVIGPAIAPEPDEGELPGPAKTVPPIIPPTVPETVEETVPETVEEKKSLRRRVAEAVDPTVAKELEDAFTDKTGLRNQNAWDKARPRIEADPEKEITVFDLANFKVQNDAGSFDMGDAKLGEFADELRMLQELGIPARNLFRGGGDEFMVEHGVGEGDRIGRMVSKAFGSKEILDKEGKGTGLPMFARYGSGGTFAEANTALDEAKALEEGPRGRDVKAQVAEARGEPAPGTVSIEEGLAIQEEAAQEGFEEARLIAEQEEGEPSRAVVTQEQALAIQEEAAREGTEEGQALEREGLGMKDLVSGDFVGLKNEVILQSEAGEEVALYPHSLLSLRGVREVDGERFYDVEDAEDTYTLPASLFEEEPRPGPIERGTQERAQAEREILGEAVAEEDIADLAFLFTQQRHRETADPDVHQDFSERMAALSEEDRQRVRDRAAENEGALTPEAPVAGGTVGGGFVTPSEISAPEPSDPKLRNVEIEGSPSGYKIFVNGVETQTVQQFEMAQTVVGEIKTGANSAMEEHLRGVMGDQYPPPLPVSRETVEELEAEEKEEAISEVLVQEAESEPEEARVMEQEAQQDAEDEVRVLMGENVASEETVADLSREEETDAKAVEEAAPTEPEREQAPAVEGIISDGEIADPPPGGRPGGPRDVREIADPDLRPEPDLDDSPSGEIRRGDGTPGDGAGERPSDGRGGPGRVPGLEDFSIASGQDVFDRGDITKTKNNIAAIRTLRDIEAQGRRATPSEQAVLVKYVGWGGLPNALEPGEKKRWKELNAELLELLTEEELEDAKRSVLNAHYTSIPIIQGMHEAMQELGLEDGALVLEPAMGIGHFMGAGPKTYKWFGVELDSITGKIAAQLYQKQDIHVRGFETVPIPDNHFDAAMSNVPFGDFKVDDPAYRSLKFNIHNYFFAKALDKVRPGGVVAFITSMFTMDSVDSSVRQYLGERADLLGAVRLPNNAFKANASTQVTTDIIFLRKKIEGQGTYEGAKAADAWKNLDSFHTPDGPVRINAYFKNNPEMMLGNMGLQGTMRARNQPALVAREGQDLLKDLRDALVRLPVDVIPARETGPATAIDLPELVDAATQEGSMRALDDGTIMQVQGGQLVEMKVAGTQKQNIHDLIQLRDQAREILRLQGSETATDAQIEAAQKELGRLHDRYVKRRGPINKETLTKNDRVLRPNWTPFRSDPDASLVAALEEYNPETGIAEKADIFTKRVIEVRKEITEVDTAEDALPVVLAETGKVDIEAMARLAGTTEEEVKTQLRGQIFEDPEAGRWVTQDEYLSGDVKRKLVMARAAALTDEEMAANVAALEEVQPEDLPPSEIGLSIGAPWVQPQVYADFFNELLERDEYNTVKVGHSRSLALFTVERGKKGHGALETAKWGTQRVPAGRIFELALNQQQPTVYDKTDDGTTKNVKQTLAAREKLQDMKAAFEEWVWKSQYAEELHQQYNAEFNTDRQRVYDGSHLRPAGMSPAIELLPNQTRGAWRIISTGNTLLAHVVGAGKTFTMMVAAMEQRRMGLVKKPMFVVPNHMLEQFSREFLQLYPSARILTAQKSEMAKDKRQALLGKVATGDWDAVIVTHDSFKAIQVHPETRKAYMREQLETLEEAIRESKKGENKNLLKTIQKAREKLKARLEALEKAEAKDPGLSFEELGVDQIYVDEAHYFKNLYAPTKLEGITMSDTQRATDLHMKTRYLETISPGRGTVFATATPISNSMTEVYTMMRYLQPKDLVSRGLEHFDSWAGMFGEHVTAAEMAPDGSGFRMASRFARFRNLPELSQIFRRRWDILRQDDLNLPIPKVKGGSAAVVAAEKSPELEAYVKELVTRSSKLGGVDPKVDNMLKITGDGRKAALDMRLVHPWMTPLRGRKAELAADNILEIYEDTMEEKSTQMVFCDFSTPSDRFNVYDDVRELLVAGGIPEAEIEYIHDHDTDARKAELFKRVRSGQVRILLGSTNKMGVGTNVQRLLVAEHHLDAPWRPADIEQRDGRMIRQGNLNDEVQLFRYVTEGSFDAYMWQTLERKAFFIEQIMSGDATLRSAEDIGGSALNAAEVKAIASGNPAAIEKASVDSDLARLRAAKRSYQDEVYQVNQDLAQLPQLIEGSNEDLELAHIDNKGRTPTAGDAFKMRVGPAEYSSRPDAGEKLVEKISPMALRDIAFTEYGVFKKVGEIAGFDIEAAPWAGARGSKGVELRLSGRLKWRAGIIEEFSAIGLVRKLENAAERVPRTLKEKEQLLADRQRRLRQAKEMKGEPFAREDELQRLLTRQKELEAELNLDKGQDAGQVSQNDEGDGPETPGREGLSEDELRERDDAGFLDIRPLFERRPQRDPLVTSEIEEVEERYQAAKGIKDLPLFEKAKNGFDGFMASMRRAHPEIDPDESTIMALNQDVLRQFGSARDWSMAMAYHEIRKVTEGLDENQLDLLTRMLVLPDIEKDWEEGLYEGKEELPFGYKDIDGLQADLRKFEAAVESQPLVAEALERRRQINRRLTNLLVKAELLPAKVMEDERYYHRQVMKYFEAKDFSFAGVGGPDVRLKKKGFQHQRVGGGDFNTAYQESEIEWMSQGWELLSRVETLQRLQELNDIKGDLKAQARFLNVQRVEAKWAELGIEGGLADPLLPFKTRIAFSNAGLAKLASQGELSSEGGRFADLIEELGEAYDDWKAEMAERDKEDREPFFFEHNQWFPFLSHLMEGGRPGAMQAGTIFKAIRQREAFLKEELGDQYIDPKNAKELVRKLAPEGYETWQPEKGTHLFLGLTVEERVLEAALLDDRALKREEVRQMLVVGGPKETWVIPSNLARTLNDVKPNRPNDAVDNLWRTAQASWKQWILLNPVRALKYNFNNMSGDADIAFAYDPKIISRFAVQAARDVAAHFRGTASEEVSKEVLESIEMGVVGSGLRVAEIPEINETGAFRFLTTGNLNPGQKVIMRYWGSVRAFTDWRENILRLAADRYFREKIEAGETQLYAASRRSEIQAMEVEEADARKSGDVGKALEIRRRRSAKLARELIGDYGNISAGGVWLRRHLIPFYSWVEINAPRYARLLANASHEGQKKGRGRAMGAVAIKKTSVAVLKMNVLFLLANLWNNLFFPDEERDLGSNRRQLHLILGRYPDGRVRSIRMEGALSDALEWFNLQDYPADIRDLIQGKKDILDQGAEFVKGPVERVMNAWEPFSKTAFELAMSRSTFPTVYEEGKSFSTRTRPIRDKKEHFLRMFSLDRLYNRVTGKPRRPTNGPLDDFLGVVLLYSTDPGEAAYWQSKELVGNFQEEMGRERTDITPTKRSTALYYWKKSVQWGDEVAAIKWETEYRNLGGTDQGMRQSIVRSAPLGGIAKNMHPSFRKSLTPKELEILQLAEEWYSATYEGRAPGRGPSTAGRRPAPPPSRQAPRR